MVDEESWRQNGWLSKRQTQKKNDDRNKQTTKDGEIEKNTNDKNKSWRAKRLQQKSKQKIREKKTKYISREWTLRWEN